MVIPMSALLEYIRLKIENFQSQVCACAASTNLICAKGRAEVGLKMMCSSETAAGWLPEEKQEYIMRRVKGEGYVSYVALATPTVPFVWVKRSNGKKRRPLERHRRFSKRICFRAAGKIYRDIGELRVSGKPGDEYGPWYKDCYGRKVFYIAERFPCFDSHDFMYEDRYHRWFFICENGNLTRVYTNDGDTRIHVTEDVGGIEDKCWREMEKAGYLDCR